ncbi:hypothetical protein CJP72_09145 [Citrobacter sp. NCU1]|nr:hypothetical protein [Citrobacter sp. NCU1]
MITGALTPVISQVKTEGFKMTCDIIELAKKIVKGERVTIPAMEWWQFEELNWWIKNLGTDLL